MSTQYVERRITSFTDRVPSDERTDDADWLIGDTRYVTLDCGHTIHGSPIMTYRVGEFGKCRECGAVAS